MADRMCEVRQAGAGSGAVLTAYCGRMTAGAEGKPGSGTPPCLNDLICCSLALVFISMHDTFD